MKNQLSTLQVSIQRRIDLSRSFVCLKRTRYSRILNKHTRKSLMYRHLRSYISPKSSLKKDS